MQVLENGLQHICGADALQFCLSLRFFSLGREGFIRLSENCDTSVPEHIAVRGAGVLFRLQYSWDVGKSDGLFRVS